MSAGEWMIGRDTTNQATDQARNESESGYLTGEGDQERGAMSSTIIITRNQDGRG